MPDPLVYLKAAGTAAVVSAIFVLMMARQRVFPLNHRWNAATCVALGLGLVTGCVLLSLRLSWPPVSGLDRFLIVIIPSVLVIEFTAGIRSLSPRLAWGLRLCLAAVVPRVLLHDSVYLSGAEAWTIGQSLFVLFTSSLLLACLWISLVHLHERTTDMSIPLSLALVILGAGVSVMMAGYIKGGVAAILLSSVLAATTIAIRLTGNHHSPVTSGIGVVGLFSVLFVGAFFGRLPVDRAILLGVAPLLCWVTAWQKRDHQKELFLSLTRVMLVAIPVIVVLVLMKLDFDHNIRPLLGQASSDSYWTLAAFTLRKASDDRLVSEIVSHVRRRNAQRFLPRNSTPSSPQPT